jgi:ribosomal protein S18 acetylase RimI-like enzyme
MILPFPAGLSIDRIGPADAAELGSFLRLLTADPETLSFFHPHPLSPRYAADLCARLVTLGDRYYLARYRGRAVGYSMLRGWDEARQVLSFSGSVHPRLRCLGVGHRLLAHGLLEAKQAGARQLRLAVDRANVRAIHLFHKFGFTFKEKNSYELLGVLDLAKPLNLNCPPIDLSLLDVLLARQAA